MKGIFGINKIRKILLGIFILAILMNEFSFNSYIYIYIIMRCCLDGVIISLSLMQERENMYINILGIGFVIASIFESFMMIRDSSFLGQIDARILSNSIEILCILIISVFSNYRLKDKKTKKYIIYITIYSLVVVILNHYIKGITEFTIWISTGVAGYIFLQNAKGSNISSSYLDIRNIIKIKIVNSLILLVSVYSFDSKALILLDFITMSQMIFLYKIMVYYNLTKPYMYINKLNNKILKDAQFRKNSNKILKDIHNKELIIKEELQNNEKIINSIMNTTPNLWLVVDNKFEVIYMNNKLDYIDINEKIDNLKNKIDNYDDFYKSIKSVHEKKIRVENEIGIYDKVYRCNYYPGDKENECICIMIDITYEKEVIYELENIKFQYLELINNVHIPMYMIETTKNTVVMNKLFYELFNININQINNNIDEEFIRDTIYRKIYIKDLKEFKMVYESSLEATSEGELYNEGKCIYRVNTNFGEVKWIESKFNIYYRKKIKYIIVTNDDISEYVKDVKQLKNIKKRYLKLLDNIPEGIYVESINENKCIFINDNIRSMFNIPSEESIKNPDILYKKYINIHPQDTEKLERIYSNVKMKKYYEYEKIRYIDNEENIINTKTSIVLFNVDNVIYKIYILKDIKYEVELEEIKRKVVYREERDKQKREFFINISHELKAPLNLIFTSTQLVEHLYDTNKIIDYDHKLNKHISMMKQNSYRLIKIISDLIDFTKVESGFYYLKCEKIDIVCIVEDMAMSMIEYANSKNINLIFDTNIEELEILVDVGSIERILLNLISNSIKFTNEGGKIFVSLIDEEDSISISVKDTGIGIKEDELNFIFNRFNGINSGYIGNTYGSGIGLSICKSIANIIGATLTCSSVYKEGSEFILKLNKNNEDIEYINYNKSETNVERLLVKGSDIYI